MTLVIRRYEDRDRPAVRDLFVRVNRALAPESMRDLFEDYIARSLTEEIDAIPAYYAARQGGFWPRSTGSTRSRARSAAMEARRRIFRRRFR